MINISGLTSALAQLTEYLERCRDPRFQSDPGLVRHLRAGAIQAFEFSFELAVRTTRRQMEVMDGVEVDRLPYRDLIRLAAERGVLTRPQAWLEFRERRNITSHTYDERKAELVFAVLDDFLAEAGILAEQVTRLNRAPDA